MSWELTSWTRPKARKPHGCRDCGRTIQPGEIYHSGKGLYEGTFDRWAVCLQCDWLTNMLVNNGADLELFDLADEFREFINGKGNYRRTFFFTDGSVEIGTRHNEDIFAQWMKWARVYAYWRRGWMRHGSPHSVEELRELTG